MPSLFQSPAFHTFSTILIGSVWIVFGVYFKILNRVPRHRTIVARVLGPRWARLTVVIGAGELLLGLWVFSGWQRTACAIVLTAAIVTMNTLEVWRTRDLLLSVPGMLCLNAVLVALIWHWALASTIR